MYISGSQQPTANTLQPMKRKSFRFIIYALLIGAVIFLLAVFLPRKYDVPSLQKRESTGYWQLSTGSRIAFTRIPAKGIKKPFPVIYLHGGPGGHIRDGIIKSLAPLADDGYDIYFYDQTGSGLSDRLPDITAYTVDRHIRDLKAITEKLGHQRVILTGQSWGAVMATIFAATYPDKVERLVLTSPGPIFPVNRELAKLQPPDSIHLQAPVFSNAQGNDKTNNIRTRAMKFFATRFGWKLATDEEADAFADYQGYEVNKSTVCDTANIPGRDAGNGFYAAIMTFNDLLRVNDYRPALRALPLPVLVMKGECDNQHWGYTREYLDVFRNHQFIFIPGAGHSLWVEQPALYLNAIREFLGQGAGAQGVARRV